MIDNLNKIKDLLKFDNDGDFYTLSVTKRKKDQVGLERVRSKSTHNIKVYTIDSLDRLHEYYDEIKLLCETFKARAYISISKQNQQDVGLEMVSRIMEGMKSNTHKYQDLFTSAANKMKPKERRWIVDVDTEDFDDVEEIEDFIDYDCSPTGRKSIALIPTKNGYHIITHKFDRIKFNQHYPDVDVQPNSPTLLYYPNSLYTDDDFEDKQPRILYEGEVVYFDNGQTSEQAEIIKITDGEVVILKYHSTGNIVEITKEDLIQLM